MSADKLVGAGLPGWDAEKAEDLRARFPIGTTVVVRPSLGPSWAGTVTGWTEPVGGCGMAIVTAAPRCGPFQGVGSYHVLATFLSEPPVSTWPARARGPRARRP